MSKGLILTDCIESDRELFLSELEAKANIPFENMFINTARWQKGISNILRYLSYVFVPLFVLCKGKEYNFIVAWQQFYGLFYAFWCNFFKLKKKKKLIVMTFIYKEKSGRLGKIYYHLIRGIVRSGYIDAFVCFSEKECQEYAEVFEVDSQIFYSCKLSVEDQYEKFEQYIEQGEYYLAAGRSNRDYDFLCSAFEQFHDRKLVIICDKFNNTKINDNICILNNTYGDEYFRYIAGCKAVIIPLNENSEVSSGQLVAIHGMMFGKVVIATENKQMKEYICDKENGFLISNTMEELGNILDFIEANDLTSMCERTRETYLNNFCEDQRSDVVAGIIKRI